jgi:RND superfamily putative drug exporter
MRNRFPVRAAVLWIAVALALLPMQSRLDASIRASSGVVGTESADVDRIVREGFASPFAQPALLVVTGVPQPVDSDSGRAVVREIVGPLLATRAVVGVLSPASSLDTLLVGADKRTALAIVGLNSAFGGAIDSVRAITTAQLAAQQRRYPGLALRWTGEPALVGDLRTMGATEARRAELKALPVSLVVSVIAFGSLAEACMAVLAAGLTIGVTLGLLGAFATAVPASAFTRTLVPLIAIALTIDYALFLARRRRDGTPDRALRRTVMLAAGVVALGFTGLALAPTGELRQAALAAALTCAVAAGAAITLEPRRRETTRRLPSASEHWHRWGAFVVRRPWTVLIVSAIPLLLLANAARSARLVTPLDTLLPAGMESADAYRALQRADRAGLAVSLRVLVTLPAGRTVMTDSGWTALANATRALRGLPGAADARSLQTIGNGDLFVAKNVLPAVVTGAYVSRDGRSAAVTVIPGTAGGDASVLDLVSRVRALDGGRVTGMSGTTIRVAGLAAYALDYQMALRRALPWIVLATSLATFLALVVTLRAPIVAGKATALNLLVAAAAIGATVLVFQDGIGAALIGQHALGSIFPTVPALAFGAAFGTSMDYELFLIGGVREALREGMSANDAIVVGLARTGGLITRAAAVMACLFLAFSTSALLPLAMVGFALAVAVALDATIVRLAIAPALLRIAGRWNWWPGAGRSTLK